jgi:hypothetical protein
MNTPYRITGLLTTLLTLLALGACAQTPVRTDHDPAADFAALESFAWVTPTEQRVEDPMLDSALLTRKVQRATIAELTSRGYREVASGEADFIVTYHTASRERIRDLYPTSSFHWQFGGGFRSRSAFGIGWSHRTPVESIQEGTLIIDIIDTRDNELVWRGWSSGPVTPSRFSNESITTIVHEILSRFPPGP